MNSNTAAISRDQSRLEIAWDNGVSIVFALEDGGVLGIRDVQVNGVPLRNPQRLWKPIIATPSGVHYHRFRLQDVEQDEHGRVTVRTEALGLQTQIQEGIDEYLGDVLNLPTTDEPPRDLFEWQLWPTKLSLDGRDFSGFAYRYHWQSNDAERKIYRIFDDATWEVGGHVEGNTLMLQGQLNPPVTQLSRQEYFTTACNYYGAEMQGVVGKPEQISIQRLPRIATLQAFDFLVHAQGVLFNRFDPTIEIFTIVQKEVGEDMLHIVDELRRPLTNDFVTYPKHILFHALPDALPPHEASNLWSRALDFVHESERKRVDIEASPVLPRVWIPQFSDDEVEVGADRFPRSRMFYYMADHILPRWAEMGVKEICTHSLWESDYTVDRYRTKNESGMQGGLTVSGICCVRVHEIDETWGGIEGVKYFVDCAHALGMQVQLWWASHLSRRAPIFVERPDFMVMARDGLPGCGGLGNQLCIPLNLNNPDCLEWEYQKMKAVYESTGIDGIFHDSYGNYSFLPVNYADPLLRGQQEACEKLLHRLQKLGLKNMAIEGIGPFGTGHFGMNLVASEETGHQYQNALDWWIGHEEMMYRLNMGLDAPVWEGREEQSRDFAFRCIAHGGHFGFTQFEDGFEMWTGWLKDLNRLHSRIGNLDGRRVVLHEGKGVLWHQRDGSRLVFGFERFKMPVETDCTVHQVTASSDTPLSCNNGRFTVEANKVYRVHS